MSKMNTRNAAMCVLGVVSLLMVAFSPTRQAFAQGADAAEKWEYKVLEPARHGPSFESQLNLLGGQGWEFVGDDTGGLRYFKRPKHH